jgi:hypothetical protein
MGKDIANDPQFLLRFQTPQPSFLTPTPLLDLIFGPSQRPTQAVKDIVKDFDSIPPFKDPYGLPLHPGK